MLGLHRLPRGIGRRSGHVSQHLLRELEHSFAVSEDLEDKKTAAIGWEPAETATRIIAEAIGRAR